MPGETKQGRIIKWEGDVPLPPIPNYNYASLMMKVFAGFGDNVALVDGKTNRSYTYSDLCRIIPSISHGLKAAGVAEGDRVLVVTRNHLDMPPVILGIMGVGAACVPINPASTEEEIQHIIRVSEAKWAVVSAKEVHKVENAFGMVAPDVLANMWVIGGELTTNKSSVRNLMMNTSEESMKENEFFDSVTTVALMPLSSGTTGLPKGVMLSHRNLISIQIQRKFIASMLPINSKINLYASVLVVLPIYHMLAFNVVMNTLFSGGMAVVFSNFNIKEYWEAVQRYQVTFAPVVPYIMRILIESPLMKNFDLSSILMFGTGSEPVSTRTMTMLSEKSGRTTLQGYGLTESIGVGSANGPGDRPVGSCVGRFGPFFQVKVVDTYTGETLGQGVDGELCLKGPLVMLGYANNPRATAEAIDSEGWLHTGDLAHFDNKEYFYITGRIKDLIKVKGYQVAPVELENVIRSFRGISEVAVAGVSDERRGEMPRAWVVPEEGATVDTNALMNYVAGRVAPYKQLAGVEVVKSLPKNHIGKIMRRKLRNSFEMKKSKL